jgi:hypothetical protein
MKRSRQLCPNDPTNDVVRPLHVLTCDDGTMSKEGKSGSDVHLLQRLPIDLLSSISASCGIVDIIPLMLVSSKYRMMIIHLLSRSHHIYIDYVSLSTLTIINRYCNGALRVLQLYHIPSYGYIDQLRQCREVLKSIISNNRTSFQSLIWVNNDCELVALSCVSLTVVLSQCCMLTHFDHAPSVSYHMQSAIPGYTNIRIPKVNNNDNKGNLLLQHKEKESCNDDEEEEKEEDVDDIDTESDKFQAAIEKIASSCTKLASLTFHDRLSLTSLANNGYYYYSHVPPSSLPPNYRYILFARTLSPMYECA